MLTPSSNLPTPPPMLFIYILTIALVFIYSTPPGDIEIRHVLPLQQFQRLKHRFFVEDVLSGVSDGIQATPTTQENTHHHHNSNNNGGSSTMTDRININTHDKIGGNKNSSLYLQNSNKNEEKELQEAERFLWRQRMRALRHADYMRIETLHFLKLVASAIPRLRLVWRGEDFCSWEGVTCTALRYSLDLLIDTPSILKKHHRDEEKKKKGNGGNSNNNGNGNGNGNVDMYSHYHHYYSYHHYNSGKSISSNGNDGARLIGDNDKDPIFTIVGIRLRGMSLFGHFPGIRPIGASRYSSPLQSSIVVSSLMERHCNPMKPHEDEEKGGGGGGGGNQQKLPITSPRDPHYWPWDPVHMRIKTRIQNNTYEMVRYTIRRILKRLELHGKYNNHSDLREFETITTHITSPSNHIKGNDGDYYHNNNNNGGGTPSQSSLLSSSVQKLSHGHEGISMLLHEKFLPPTTRRDIAHAVFGEIEPRLVSIHRLDISYNPGILITNLSDWPFPYMRRFDTFGTSVRSVIHKEIWENCEEELCW